MFSRFHHRRAPSSNSTPTSPTPPGSDQLTAWEAAALQEKQQPHHQVSHRPPSSSSASNAPSMTAAPANTTSTTTITITTTTSSPTSDMPPSLPPIARVTSAMTVSSDRSYDFLGDLPTNALPQGASYSAPSSSLDTRRPPSQPAQIPAQYAPRMSFPPQTAEPMPPQSKPNEPSFIGGVALANMRRQGGAQDLSTAAATAATANAARRPSSSQSTATSPTLVTMASPPVYGTPERRMSRSKPPPPPINTNLASRQYLSTQTAAGGQAKDPRSGSRSATSFVTPTDLLSSAAAAAAAAASAANAANEVYNSIAASSSNSTVHSSAASAAAAANARTKKSRPFLMKNPVSSLLGRRKTASSAMDLTSLSMANNDGSVYVPIRGTRFHDFSAPRPQRVVTNDPPAKTSTAAAAAAAAIANATGTSKPAIPTSSTRQPPTTSPISVIPPSSQLSDDNAQAPRPVSSDGPVLLSQAVQQPTTSSYPPNRNSSVTPDAAQNYVAPFPKQPVADLRGPMRIPSQSALQTLQENRTLSFDEKPLPERPTTEDSPRTSDVAERPASSVRTASTSTRSRVASADVSSLLKSSPSTGTTRSRNLSLSDFSPNANTADLPSTSATTPASVMSSLPKHMKSTSSRFSFMTGPASEEKLLEERHRQKQAEKNATHPGDEAFGDNGGPRDSRFDDFDEDGFDYDAMMDDDGLEERIPGVNADADDAEDDYHLFGQDQEEEIPYVGVEDDVPETGVNDNDAYDSHYEDAVTGLEVEEQPAMQAAAEDDDPEGLDPNNDQENFAGFVFQRSNPASSLVSPISAGMTATPRDANGRAIGFAVTKDTTPDLHPPSVSSLSPLDAHNTAQMMMMNMKMASYGGTLVPAASADIGGLGIQHMSALDEERELGQDGDDEDDDLDHYEDDIDTAETTVTIKPQGLAEEEQTIQHQLPVKVAPPRAYGDDLYFDQGLTDELDFGDPEASTAPFDESIFDNHDTDEYGRPIPGAFARAQAERAAMAAAIEAASTSVQRGSDVPSSQMSEKSQIAGSTAHTSMSVVGAPFGGPPPMDKVSADGLAPPQHEDTTTSSLYALASNSSHSESPVPILSSQFAPVRKHEDSLAALRRQLPPIMTDAERVAAYQAALAAATYKAAASGKFRRDSSPPRFSPEPTSSPPGLDMGGGQGSGLGLGVSLGVGDKGGMDSSSPMATAAATGLGPEASDSAGAYGHLAYAFTSQRDLDYHYDFDDNDEYTQDMDDYDFDDEAIIAEANAEALANDMDGFYGQEFNFYSAPAHLHGSGSGSGSGGGGGGSASSTLKDQIEFANGGYFMPSTGVGRSTSGRVVSREPNLTPITERSEYSNRNSFLSLAVPPLGGSGELRSPSLIQLAQLAEDNDMTMSALQRLRSRTFGGGSQASLSSSREGSPMLIAPGDRERGDRDSASSPFGGATYYLLQQQQQQLQQQQQQQQQQHLAQPHYHHRINSASSFSPRGGAGSGLNSEAGSDCGSPTLTNFQAAALQAAGLQVAGLPIVTSPLPISPVPLAFGAPLGPMSSSSSCPPVVEEEDEAAAAAAEPASSSDVAPAGVSGVSSMSGSGLWMRSPEGGGSGSGNEKRQPQRALASPPSPAGPPPPIPPMSSRRPGMGHRHKGSADSISYVKEDDNSGSGKSQWVMERRRQGESGEVELLEREVVEGI